MDHLLTAMGVFIRYPLLAGAIGVLLLALGRWTRRRLIRWVGLAWMLYAVYEIGMQQRWLCSGECNIRLDLFLLYPALLIGLAAVVVSLLRPPGRPPTTHTSKRIP